MFEDYHRKCDNLEYKLILMRTKTGLVIAALIHCSPSEDD